MGMCFFSSVPGLVPDNPLRPTLARMGWSKRSMVAAEMLPSMASVSADSGWKLVPYNGSAALRRLLHNWSDAIQMVRNASASSGVS